MMFSSDFKQAYVLPIFEKDDSEDPNIYGPIYITASLSNVFEKFVDKLPTMLITTNYFPRKTSISEKTFSRRLHWFSQLKKKKLITITWLQMSLDLLNASDFISFEILFKKAVAFHFGQNANSLIWSFFTGRTQKVVLSISKCDWIKVYQRVP